MVKFFCCCEECGSTEWVELDEDENGRSNANGLDKDGEVVVKNRMKTFLKHAMNVSTRKDYYNYYCVRCENRLFPISFKEVPRGVRKKLYFMSEEEKISWVKGYLLSKNIIEENEAEKNDI